MSLGWMGCSVNGEQGNGEEGRMKRVVERWRM